MKQLMSKIKMKVKKDMKGNKCMVLLCCGSRRNVRNTFIKCLRDRSKYTTNNYIKVEKNNTQLTPLGS